MFIYIKKAGKKTLQRVMFLFLKNTVKCRLEDFVNHDLSTMNFKVAIKWKK